MADDTRPTSPGDAPGVLKTSADGSVPDLGNRRGWVRMQDTEEGGGGRFDVLSHRVDMWRRKGATVVPDYPIHFGPSGRLATPRVALGDLGGRRDSAAAEGSTPADGQAPPPSPTLTLPASAVGVAEPTGQTDTAADTDQVDAPRLADAQPGEVDNARLDEARPDIDVDDTRLSDAPPADAGDTTDQALGEPAAAKTTTTRKAGRSR